MEWTGEAAAVTAARGCQNPRSPVRATVEKSLDGIGGRAHHDHRVGADIVDIGIAHILQVLLPAGPLPGPPPEPVYLLLEESPRGIAAEWNVFIAQEFIPTWDDPILALRHACMVCDV